MADNPFAVAERAELPRAGALISAEQQRAVAEVQGRMIIARASPRDPMHAMDAILQDCTRLTLAQEALYAYSRGGQQIEGPSIRLMETIARRWGNIASGIKEMGRADGYSECAAYAWDLETNYYDERQFRVRHWRDTKGGGRAIADERDIYEMIANMGQRRKRAVLQAVIPGDVVEEAVARCAKTLASQGDTSPDAIKRMVAAFAALGVAREQLEAHCQRRIETILPAQVIQLRKIYQSIKDEMSRPEDWFGPPPAGGGSATAGNAGLRQRMRETTTAAPQGEAATVAPGGGDAAQAAADDLPAHVLEREPPMYDEDTGEIDEAPIGGARETPGAGSSTSTTADAAAQPERENAQAKGPATDDQPPQATGSPEPEPKERAEFWAQPRLYVAPVPTGSSDRPDWKRTHDELLSRIRDARTADELQRLRTDSKRTIQGLRLSYIGLYDNVVDAIAKRMQELGRG